MQSLPSYELGLSEMKHDEMKKKKPYKELKERLDHDCKER